ncbi:MAG: radical SAM protein [Elusimicrobia bacterium]|nr:radical SAM protein [Elusimicrobiota bacterium]
MEYADSWEKVIRKFDKPGKYLGTEYNAYQTKPGTKRFLLCFPDDYIIGMSSLGLHTVGKIIHGHEGFSCERCFAPGPDMEEWMRENSAGLVSLETRTAAREFDVIGFSLQYEMAFTNFLNMLDLAGLRHHRQERGPEDPVIMAGGPSCINPEVLSDFIDMFIIGEAESVLPEVLDTYLSSRGKQDFLSKVTGLKGIYVPGAPAGETECSVYSSLDNRYYPYDHPVALIDIPHSRINIEINRGCRNSCRFCQARSIYAPYREKPPARIMEIARKAVASTGYGEISLTSLSATDHKDLTDIIDDLYYAFRDLGVSVMMSSMRPSGYLGGLSDRLTRLRKSSLTFAPETASERMKRIINKNIKNSDIIEAARTAGLRGYRKIKLYFMVGLPGEEEEDIDAIVDLIREVKKASGINVNTTVSPMIPQPHTPFQWINNVPAEELAGRIQRIKRRAGAKIGMFNEKQHIIESILVRGDRELGKIVLSACKNGARFDQWTEHFDFSAWEAAFRDNGSDWKDWYYRDFGRMEKFPWDHICTGIPKERLRKSYADALGRMTGGRQLRI